MARLRRKLSPKVFQMGGAYTGNVYRGRIHRMRGGGIFGTLAGLGAKALGTVGKALMSKTGKAVAKNVGKAGLGLVQDLAQKKNFKRAAAARGKAVLAQSGQNIMDAVTAAVTTPRPRRKKAGKKTRRKGRKQKGAGRIETLYQPTKYKKTGARAKANVFGEKI